MNFSEFLKLPVCRLSLTSGDNPNREETGGGSNTDLNKELKEGNIEINSGEDSGTAINKKTAEREAANYEDSTIAVDESGVSDGAALGSND
ncbi:MAG TPA: hypothetical protein VH186_25200 [Chloroflexia bacterium]|nr:hypothetical protein [Chloroflexia bacterium]